MYPVWGGMSLEILLRALMLSLSSFFCNLALKAFFRMDIEIFIEEMRDWMRLVKMIDWIVLVWCGSVVRSKKLKSGLYRFWVRESDKVESSLCTIYGTSTFVIPFSLLRYPHPARFSAAYIPHQLSLSSPHRHHVRITAHRGWRKTAVAALAVWRFTSSKAGYASTTEGVGPAGVGGVGRASRPPVPQGRCTRRRLPCGAYGSSFEVRPIRGAAKRWGAHLLEDRKQTTERSSAGQ